MSLALVARCLLLAALVAASAACSAYWYASPFPKPAGLSAMGFVLEWLGFVFLWFAFRRWKPLLWVVGALLVFPLAQALVNWVAGEMDPAVDFRGWGGFQAVFMLRLMVSCWLCMAAYAVYFILQQLLGRSANVVCTRHHISIAGPDAAYQRTDKTRVAVDSTLSLAQLPAALSQT